MTDHHLEHLLKGLRPAAPSPELVERVQRDMDLIATFREAAPVAQASTAARRPPAAWLSNLVCAGLGAAAAVVAMGIYHSTAATGKAPYATVAMQTANTGAILPVSSTREWIDVEDQGISFTAPDSPERKMKVLSVERQQWIDPRDGAEYIVEVPKEESLTLPIKFQ